MFDSRVQRLQSVVRQWEAVRGQGACGSAKVARKQRVRREEEG